MNKQKEWYNRGRIEVITGPMFSGKTSWLIKKYEGIKPFRPVMVYITLFIIPARFFKKYENKKRNKN